MCRKIPPAITPNQITSLGLIFSLVGGCVFGLGKAQLAGLLLLAAGFFDLLDGACARSRGQITQFGAFWDSTIDRYSDLIVMGGITISFARVGQILYVLLSVIATAGFVMISYTKARAENIIGSCTVGLMERPERILVLSAGSIVNCLKPTIWILAILCHQTVVHRIWFTYKKTRI
ncbi:MAG: CDP-alcohol phosphatidyltransferase family protein [bacterium]